MPMPSFSALSLAEGMDPQGHLTTLERDHAVADDAEELLRTARSQVPDLPEISLVRGDAIASMEALKQEGARFDLSFVDANKKKYWDYYEVLVDFLMVPGGVMIFDNTLFRKQGL